MGEGLVVRPQITATLEHRKAESSCCGAKLNPGAEPGTFTCRACAQPCERVMGEPQEVTAHG